MIRAMVIFAAVFYIVRFMLLNYTLVETKVTIPIEIPPYEETGTNLWGVKYTEEDLYCLALNVYFEARGEPIEGQYAVSDVVMNRVLNAEYPDTICDVVKDKGAFSWYKDKYSNNPVDGKAFKKALYVAEDVLNNPNYEGTIGNALFYHADYVSPYWVDNNAMIAKVGRHIFYTSARR